MTMKIHPEDNALFSTGVKGRIKRLVFSTAFLLLSLIDSRLNLFPVDPAWFAVALCAFPMIVRTVSGLLTRKDVRSEALSSLALILLLLSGKVFLTGLISMVLSFGSLSEDVITAKAQSRIERLVYLMPEAARVITENGQSYVHLEDIQTGDVIRVLTGETIPVDGVILRGQASVNRAMITGEPSPEDKAVNDKVLSGSVVHSGSFDMRAGKTDADSFAQRMIRVVRFADAEKAKASRNADRRATWALVIAVIAAGLTWILTEEVLRAAAVLTAVFPCCVVPAVSSAFTSAIGSAAKHGFLVRRGDALERIAGSDTVTVSIPADTPDAVKLNIANQFLLTGINAQMISGDADVVLAEDRVWVPSHLKKLSKRLMKTVKRESFLAVLINAPALVLAVTGLIGPLAGALIHAAGSVLIVFSASTLFRFSRKHASRGVESRQPQNEPVHHEA